MKILALDTALAACSVAIWCDGTTEASAHRLMDRGQAEQLMPMIADVMRQAGVSVHELDRIAVTVGPGSFTGVRVGLAAARGLALTRNTPVIGITTGEALASEAVARLDDSASVASLIDSKRGDLYVEFFNAAGEREKEAVSLSVDDAVARLTTRAQDGALALVGDGTRRVRRDLGSAAWRILTEVVYPEPSVIAAVASRRAPVPGGPAPLYVRPPDVTLPKS